MSTIKKCDLCGRTINNKPDLPEYWSSLSRLTLNGDRLDCGQIDVCNVCRSHLAEFTEQLEEGTLTINSEYYENLRLSTDVLKFVLGKDNRKEK